MRLELYVKLRLELCAVLPLLPNALSLPEVLLDQQDGMLDPLHKVEGLDVFAELLAQVLLVQQGDVHEVAGGGIHQIPRGK